MITKSMTFLPEKVEKGLTHFPGGPLLWCRCHGDIVVIFERSVMDEKKNQSAGRK